jgi:transcription elongation factor SPT6
MQTKVQALDAQNKALNDPGPIERITKKMSRSSLWNRDDYAKYLTMLTDSRLILDLNSYLNLIKEGNDSIRKKEVPMLTDQNDSKGADRRRSRRFDRDFYRTCVSEGLRAICYRFLLSPNRVGIKLEDNLMSGGFNFSKTMEGEENEEGSGDPLRWTAPTIPTTSPSDFANELIGSGELVLLSSTGGGEADVNEARDPLRGCRYVAAMELASEPRIRRHLREIYRKYATMSTKPTKKGYDVIDAFHDYYGLHVIRSKPLTEHFPLSESDILIRKSGLSSGERKEFDNKTRELERHSCLQYLNILKAEKSGDISVHIHLPFIHETHDWYDKDATEFEARDNQDLGSLMNELERVYLPPDGDTDEWNEERNKVLRFALTNFLLPQFEMEARRDLAEAAKKIGVRVASEKLKEMAMEGPYRPTAILHTENRFRYPTGDLPIVGVCCANDAKDASYLVSVTGRGETSDHLAIPSGTRIEVGKMREKVILFLIKERPAAVVVGTSGGFASRMLQRKLNDLVTEAVMRWNNREIQGEDEDDEAFETRRKSFKQFQTPGYYDDDDDEDDEWKCNVDLINDEVSQLFGRSVRGKKEFPDYAINLKCAISMARYAKDPLGELTYTWSVASDAGVFGTEMLFLNIHAIQQLLPKALLLREYERVLIEVVSDVGVDLNAACSIDHLSGYLMFVSGLGPRKATNLKQTVKKSGGAVSRRRDLLENRLLGPIVYNNAVAFIRIEETDRDQMVHPLDETRLHPDVYLRNNWAVKIAFDALEREDPTSKEAAAIKALRDVMDNSHTEIDRLFKESKAEWERIYGPTFNVKDWNPRIDVPAEHWNDKVEELDLDTFADMIESNGHGKWHSHLEMIKWEFRLPFADPRKPMEPLSGDKLFHLITGESDQSLRPGKEVTGKVVRNGDFGSRVKLEGDIPAFIPLKNLSDDHVESADDYVAAGQIVTAVVTDVKKDHMTVDMSLKMEDFRRNPSTWQRPQSLPPFDDHFDFGAAQRIEEANNKRREAHIEALQHALGNKTDEDGQKRRGRVARRACTHPAFRNLRNDEIEKELRSGGLAMVGEALIRPSSKSSDSLAIHWMAKEGCIKVIEVTEEDKETDASIGNKLMIKVSLVCRFDIVASKDFQLLTGAFPNGNRREKHTVVLTSCSVDT